MCVHVYCFCALVCIQSNTSAADNFKTEWPVWRLYSACPIFQVFLMACSTTEMVKLNWAVKILCVQVAWIWLIAWNTINAHSCSTPALHGHFLWCCSLWWCTIHVMVKWTAATVLNAVRFSLESPNASALAIVRWHSLPWHTNAPQCASSPLQVLAGGAVSAKRSCDRSVELQSLSTAHQGTSFSLWNGQEGHRCSRDCSKLPYIFTGGSTRTALFL